MFALPITIIHNIHETPKCDRATRRRTSDSLRTHLFSCGWFLRLLGTQIPSQPTADSLRLLDMGFCVSSAQSPFRRICAKNKNDTGAQIYLSIDGNICHDCMAYDVQIGTPALGHFGQRQL